jgi:hypothetical protein
MKPAHQQIHRDHSAERIVAPLLDRCPGRLADPISIGTQPSAEALSALRSTETIGRPLGSAAFLTRVAPLTP